MEPKDSLPATTLLQRMDDAIPTTNSYSAKRFHPQSSLFVLFTGSGRGPPRPELQPGLPGPQFQSTDHAAPRPATLGLRLDRLSFLYPQGALLRRGGW